MDVNRLRTGEKIAAVAALLLFIVMFLSWFGIPDIETGVPGFDVENFADSAGLDTTANAWQSFGFIDIVLFVTILAAVGLAAASAMARTVALPVAASAITAGLGILSTLLVLYRIIDPPSDADREIFVFVGLLLAAAIAYGGWRAMQEEGTTFSGEADRLGDRGDSTPGAGPGGTTPGAGPTTGTGGTGTTGTTGTTTTPGSQPPPPPPPPPSGGPAV